MLNSKIEQLKQRVSKLVNNLMALTDQEVEHVEKSLNIVLPEDFKALCKYCSYEKFRLYDAYNFRMENAYGVIYETNDNRKILNLPHEYVLLSQGDIDALLIKTIDYQNSQVIWCDLEDFCNICDSLPMEYKPTIFESFTDFYEFLLDEEEKIIAEDNSE